MKLKKVKMLLLAGAVMSMCIGTTAFAKVTESNSIVDTNKGYEIMLPESLNTENVVEPVGAIVIRTLEENKTVKGNLKISNTEDGTFDGKFKTRNDIALLKVDDTADYVLKYVDNGSLQHKSVTIGDDKTTYYQGIESVREELGTVNWRTDGALYDSKEGITVESGMTSTIGMAYGIRIENNEENMNVLQNGTYKDIITFSFTPDESN